MTRVFISFSGDISREVATALYDWLPTVIQEVKPFMSTNIAKGSQWISQIGDNLENAAFGILCVTKDNLSSPWLHYEAGALSQKLPARTEPRVSPVLHKVPNDNLRDPLRLLQTTNLSDKESIYALLRSINENAQNKLPLSTLEVVFERAYGELRKKLDAIGEASKKKDPSLEGTEPQDSPPAVEEILYSMSQRLQQIETVLGGRESAALVETPTWKVTNVSSGRHIPMKVLQSHIYEMAEAHEVKCTLHANLSRRTLTIDIDEGAARQIERFMNRTTSLAELHDVEVRFTGLPPF